MPYVAATAFTHLGRAYAPGDAVDPKPSLLGQLLAAGCIKEVPPPVPVGPLATVAPSVAAAPRVPTPARKPFDGFPKAKD